MPIKLNSAGGGSVTINAASTASATVLTVPATNANLVTTGDSGSITQTMLGAGVVGNGPAFGVYSTAAQTVTTNTWTKIQMNVEEFDTANCFDSTTNYRFTPNVAGYYQINGAASITTSTDYMTVGIYKNGGEFKRGSDVRATNTYSLTVGCLIYLNGSTDYIEFWIYQGSGGNRTINSSPINNYFSGFLARAA